MNPPASPVRPGNVLHCPRCGRSFRFVRVRCGHAITVREKRWPWSREAQWRSAGEWSGTLGQFRCRCGSGLTVR